MSAPDENGWMPIETAPRDGTAVWIAHPEGVGIGYCEPANMLWSFEDRWCVKAFVRPYDREEGETRPDDIAGTYWRVDPTHWQPLPKPPVVQP